MKPLYIGIAFCLTPFMAFAESDFERGFNAGLDACTDSAYSCEVTYDVKYTKADSSTVEEHQDTYKVLVSTKGSAGRITQKQCVDEHVPHAKNSPICNFNMASCVEI